MIQRFPSDGVMLPLSGPGQRERVFEPLSTRLFPKNAGASTYRLTGLAAMCDWVILSDNKVPGAMSASHVSISKRAGQSCCTGSRCSTGAI